MSYHFSMSNCARLRARSSSSDPYSLKLLYLDLLNQSDLQGPHFTSANAATAASQSLILRVQRSTSISIHYFRRCVSAIR